MTLDWHRARGMGEWKGDGEVMLQLPEIRQKGEYDCGPTARKIVEDYLGIRIPTVHATPVDGLSPSALENAFRKAGACVLSGNMTISDLRHQTRLGRPVVCLVTHKGEGHYVVVAGVGTRYVHYQCPDEGRRMELDSRFLQQWYDHSARWGYDYKCWGIAVWV